MRKVPIIILFAIIPLLASCAHQQQRHARLTIFHGNAPAASPSPAATTKPVKTKTGKPYQVAGVWYYPIASNAHYNRTGIASWYGKKFHGKKTANGERYDMYAMTAAHTTLPLPSMVRVTNLSNGRSIIVRINDRGPFVNDRIIDLSYTAAKKLDMIQHGTARVRVQTINAQGVVSNGNSQEHQRKRVVNGKIYVQLGAFRSFETAKDMRQRLHLDFPTADIVHRGHDDLYRVRVGPFANEWRSQQIIQQLQDEGYAHPMMVVQ